ncbi:MULTISPECIES: hypothetical protein [Haloferacaceae]|uniref:Uncharacterized protein n=1 Tax=Halorubrum glutamatedens TaxID=2707018 RepID=A0ABD5QT78_9EURY|nr:hypothetical protein [Halobellus captivus]
MTAPEVQWVFDTLDVITTDTALAWGTASDVADGAVPVRRIDRNDSEIADGNIQSRRGELTKSNFVTAEIVDDDSSHGGWGDDYDTEAIVSLRVEGLLRGDEFGHVHPDGENGIPFTTLYRRVRDALREQDEHPDVSGQTYHTLFLENGTNRSGDYEDFYDYRLDCRFAGYD